MFGLVPSDQSMALLDVDQLFENAFYFVLPFCFMGSRRSGDLFARSFCHIYYYNEKAAGSCCLLWSADYAFRSDRSYISLFFTF
jgi:hypothetical protein